MYPLDYEKFLWAMKREKLSKEIKKHFLNNEAMPEALNKVAMELYQQYFIIGGMPAAIRTYLETESYIKVQPVQNDILSAFIADMSKYANPTTRIKIRACYNSIPAQYSPWSDPCQHVVRRMLTDNRIIRTGSFQ